MQSYRGLVERIIRCLKEFGISQGGTIDSIEKLEMEVDIVCELHNLKVRTREKLLKKIPKKGKFEVNAHIITPDLDPPLKIPRSVPLDSPKVPSHVTRFREELSSIVPKLERILKGDDPDCPFSGRVLARGNNLFEGCNVLQVAVQDEDDGLYTVRFHVGASMKNPVYKCFVQIKKDVGVVQQVCECKQG